MAKKRRRLRRQDFQRWFPGETKREEILSKVRPKIQRKVRYTNNTQSRLIGRIRERKVSEALQALKNRGIIHDYLSPGPLSYDDLIEGVDFIFIYPADGVYKTCRFSVTGPKGAKKDQERHPEIPVISVEIDDDQYSIECKIMRLRNGQGLD